MTGRRWVLHGRLTAFTCLLIIHTLSSHRLVFASLGTRIAFGEWSSCSRDVDFQTKEFIFVPRDGSPKRIPSTLSGKVDVHKLNDDNLRLFNNMPVNDVMSMSHYRFEGKHVPYSRDLHLTSRVMYWKPVELRNSLLARKPPDHYSWEEPTGDRAPLSFSTTFQVRVIDDVFYSPSWLLNGTAYGTQRILDGVDGLAFIIVPDAYAVGEGGGYLGLLNSDGNASSTTSPAAHTFGVELDLVKNKEFQDADPTHVGIDVGSMTSAAVAEVPTLTEGRLMNDQVFQVWIEYHNPTSMLEIRVANQWDYSVLGPGLTHRPDRPDRPTLARHIDLSNVLLDFMYVGISTAVKSCGNDLKVNNYRVATPLNFNCLRVVSLHNWCFQTFESDSNASVADCRPCSPSEESLASRSRRTAICVASVLVLVVVAAASLRFYLRWDDRRRWRFDVDANIEEGPHRFSYKELKLATVGFSPKQALGRGGFGSVYKGFLPGNQVDVAVKRVAHESKQGEKEFLAEVQIIGKVWHRHLVRLQGWCHERGELLLVYDYLSGGSLDRILFKEEDDLSQSDSTATLFPWENRWKAVQGIAAAVAYLHEECDQRIVHRDIKAGNVMLDAKMNARLGDFGLARSYQHSMLAPESTMAAGTFGYLAPELFRSGKATEKSDVYSCGVFFLEVACGRRPMTQQHLLSRFGYWNGCGGCLRIPRSWKLQTPSYTESSIARR